jgi:acyl transferase domain-containing protein
MDFLSDEAKEYQGMRPGLDIAVIGAAGRFPGARDLHEFWDNLKNGVESIAFFSDTELLESGVSPEELKMANYVRAKGFLEDIEYFDASFFGYSPGEAEKMDPQMRILHECAWHALEGAGYDPYGYGGAIGLYVGAQNNFHWQARVFLAGSGNAVEAFNSLNLVDKDHISTRVAYKLNLTGPTFTLVTQCSTSLVALHQACQGLMSRECDIALAGGVCITLPRKAGYSYQEGMIYSPDGHLRAFAARGNGTVFGNGVGIVVLKPIEDALADGDDVMAVIKSSFVNNDGNRKVGYAAPSVEGQAEALRWALELAGVEPESISYLETHGTATPIGDAIEIDALKLAFDTGKGHCCRIGTVKTNIGHLENAAGAAGLIKTILALKHRLIPPSLHFEAPNPGIDFGQGPFVVNAELTEWKRDGYPLRAGVSSFGIGGTNAHVVLEEAPVSGPSPAVSGENKKQREYRLILLSAHSETALEKMSEKLADALTKNPGLDLADVSYTLQVGRRVFKYKQALVCRSRQEAVGALRGQEVSPGPMPATGSAPRVHVQTFFNNHDNRSLYFMFPGLGSQYVDMGRELYEAEPVFRREVDRCAAILEPLLDYDIKEILYPGDPVSKGVRKSDNSDKSAIHRIDVAQVVVFVFEYALARLVMAWGIRPHALIGYSFGEYVAACLSGFFSLEDALGVVVYRGQLLREIPGGAMSSVPLTAAELTPLLPPDLYIAVDNGPSCIVSGLKETVEAFEEELKKKKYLCMRLAGEQAIN